VKQGLEHKKEFNMKKILLIINAFLPVTFSSGPHSAFDEGEG
jgi:hypothetical protein